MKRTSRGNRAHKRLRYIKREPTQFIHSLAEYNVGDKVLIKLDPAIHSAMPNPRILGKIGEVIKVLAPRVYEIDLCKKTYIIRSEHLRWI
jgi:large subunit ribosomal protein L21e